MNRISRFISWLEQRQWQERITVTDWKVRKAAYLTPGVYQYADQADGDSAAPLDAGRLDGGHGTTYFLSTRLEIPQGWGEDAALLFQGGGEALLRVDGDPYHGLDANHGYVPLPASRVGSRPSLEIELYDPIPEPEDPLNHQAVIKPPVTGVHTALVRVNRPVQSLFFTAKAALEAARLLPEQDLRRIRTHAALTAVMDRLYSAASAELTDGAAVAEAEQRLAEAVGAETDAAARSGTMHMVGQSHIDIAWLWPVRETVRKVGRTFSTVCALMDQYPDFRYSQSQPQLYAYAKSEYPQLYARMKAFIAEGRWELVGGMWVEPDLNLPSGESLVRQMLYGQLFYEREFGKRSVIEWLPDTFGYCASLPQLLKQAGIQAFMTTKLGWNDTNKFPYELFQWVGIDGTAILSYQNHGLNEHTHAEDIQKHWESYSHKDQHDELMLLYGHGDGGGGVTHGMVEGVRRAGVMPGLPVPRFAAAADFFAGIAKRQPVLPQWHGDLYLELHRGTFTTHARNKRNNRKAEVLYREAELWGRFTVPAAEGRARAAQGEELLRKGWELMLLNQFHDIIPGTAIPEVYATSAKDYERIFAWGNEALAISLQELAAAVDTRGEGKPYLLFNSLGWSREEVVEITGGAELAQWQPYDGLQLLDFELLAPDSGTGAGDSDSDDQYRMFIRVPAIPAFGWKTLRLQAAEAVREPALSAAASGLMQPLADIPDVWETPEYSLRFNAAGEIVGWLDKAAGRELIPAGRKANELQLFSDTPTYWDAWDIDPRYEQQRAEAAQLLSRKVLLRGSAVHILRFRWLLNDSEIEQELILYPGRRRVDFRTTVHWRERHKLLKVAFPLDIVAAKAACEIPFGAIERPAHRNTSWEQAQFEVCAHRFIDYSEHGYGVSLLNDCKYGTDSKDGLLRLSLLRAPSWPDAAADQGRHIFTYSLFPHEGDWRGGHTVREAAALNHPLTGVFADSHQGPLPAVHSVLGLQSRHVVLDTVKAAEAGDGGTILRFYESAGGRERVTLEWVEPEVSVYAVNLLEDELEELEHTGGRIELAFKAYEVKSVKILPRHRKKDM